MKNGTANLNPQAVARDVPSSPFNLFGQSGAPQSLILGLLLLAVTINYIDRGSRSVAAPSMAREFSLSDAQRGWLFSAFFWTYSLCQIGAGWLADRFNAKWVYA